MMLSIGDDANFRGTYPKIGTVTNEDGEFQLAKIPGIKSEIVIPGKENKCIQSIKTKNEFGRDKKENDGGVIPLMKTTIPTELLSDQCLTIDGKTFNANSLTEILNTLMEYSSLFIRTNRSFGIDHKVLINRTWRSL